MDKELAAEVVANLMKVGACLDQTVALIKEKASANELTTYRPAFGTAMGELYLEVLEPILREHPSLIPPGWDWLKSEETRGEPKGHERKPSKP
jgi:hypothetical protein